MNYIVIVAHPDDEILGAGGTIYNLAKLGHEVNVCYMSGGVFARKRRPTTDRLNANIEEATTLLGVKHVIKGEFPNIEFNNVPHLKLVQFIEDALVSTSADIVFTHHPADLNNDHLHTSLACQAAIRLFQRNDTVKPISELLFMEVPSATEWSLNTSMMPFRPNVFFEIGEQALNMKIEALSKYDGVIRDYPHARSELTLKGLAVFRGSQAGLAYAEAFESVIRRVKLDDWQ